jgi:lipoyl(octanoyl) transferase
MKLIKYRDLGTMDYKACWDLQEELFDLMINQTSNNGYAGYLLFVEHPHVFTLGKSGDSSNLLANEAMLKQKGAQFYHINRGGDITYHGPGQLVGYPILKLDLLGLGVRAYITQLEEVIINTLEDYGIKASRLDGAAGVWLDADKPTARKICAIGVRTSKMVTMHGFAFNVNTDLSYYNMINPCGFTDKGVTSMQKELGHEVDLAGLKLVLSKKFAADFDVSIRS